ncbi:MAG: mechanosensitive ion channel [Ruminococcus sp.]|jgi:small conductance mechanosensitive channel|nr:mechanosensitive ion channel [Ruminococcus sp.]
MITTAVTTETATQPQTDVIDQVEKASGLLSNFGEKFKAVLPTVIFAIVIFALGIVLSKVLIKIIHRFMSKSNIDNAATSFLVSLIKVILYTLIIVICLTLLNVPMSSIIAVIGAAGLAISLAMQNSLSNLAGGFIILFAKPFKSGDTIETEGSIGVVESITILYTKIITADNKTVLIPNGKVSNAKIINYTDLPTRRLDMSYDISYNNDFETAKMIISKIAADSELVLDEPEPLIRLGAHKESSLEIIVKVWVKNENYFEASYQMSEAVKKEFDSHNIEIPYNQLDVHIIEN